MIKPEDMIVATVAARPFDALNAGFLHAAFGLAERFAALPMGFGNGKGA